MKTRINNYRTTFYCGLHGVYCLMYRQLKLGNGNKNCAYCITMISTVSPLDRVRNGEMCGFSLIKHDTQKTT